MKCGKRFVALVCLCLMTPPGMAQVPAGESDPTSVETEVPEVLTSPGTAPAPAPSAGGPTGDGAATGTNLDCDHLDDQHFCLNAPKAKIEDIIRQISAWTKRNFILDSSVQSKEITILSERPMTRGEVYQAFLSALNVAGYTIVEGPGGVFKVVGLTDAKKYPIPTHVDTTPVSDLFITRLVTMRNISAKDMYDAIKDMISKGGSISAYTQTNTLIITDSGTNIDRLMKIVKELDQEGPQQTMEIMPVKHASAKEIAGIVNQLFEQKTQAGKTKPKAGEPVDIEEVSKLIPDDRTNSIIVLASKRAMDQVRSIIQRLDQKMASGQEGHIHVYYLKYAKADELATTLTTLVSGTAKKPEPGKGGKGQAADSGAVVAELEGGIKVTADKTVNALIITSTFKDFKTLVEKVISKLDVRRRQVYLEAVVMELSIDTSKDYGFSGHGGIGAGAALGFGQSFGALSGIQSGLLSGPESAPALLGGLISQRTVNLQTVGAQGQSQSISIPAFSAFITALSTYGNANIISTPNLLTLENEEATIEVQEKEPIPGAQSIGQGGVTTINPVQYEEAGLTMKIKPSVGYGDSIALKIEQELSTFGARVQGLNAPSKSKRKVQTNVLCQDGQTIVIGGLMQDEMTAGKRKIPVLGDIPLLGFFFSRTNKQVGKRNLLIFLTPYIVRDSRDFQDILQRKIEQRNSFVQQNYGKKQQETIRDMIRTHREDLLEFSEGWTEPPAQTPVRPSSVKSVLPGPESYEMSRGAPAAGATRGAPTGPAPIISVPPLSPVGPAVGPPVRSAPTTSKGVTTSSTAFDAALDTPVEKPTWLSSSYKGSIKAAPASVSSTPPKAATIVEKTLTSNASATTKNAKATATRSAAKATATATAKTAESGVITIDPIPQSTIPPAKTGTKNATRKKTASKSEMESEY
ncbi:MAG: type II secretion system secretin GspD [Deltaproteobacteria bacterium]|nr:type II secretion system secretin GspD [Deltaproteobacteria bacterium]